jgi:hypothetical protein
MRATGLLCALACFSTLTFYRQQQDYPLDMTALVAQLYPRPLGPTQKPFEEKLYIYNPDRLVLVNYASLSAKGVIVTTQKDYFTTSRAAVYGQGNYYLLSLQVRGRRKQMLTLNFDGTKYDGFFVNDSIGAIGVMDGNEDIVLVVKNGKFVYSKQLKQYY